MNKAAAGFTLILSSVDVMPAAAHPHVFTDAKLRKRCPVGTFVSAVPLAPFARCRERRCSEPLRASTHDDFRAYA